MIDVISIRSNSVRIRSGIFYFDVKVKIVGGKKQIIMPKHEFFLPDASYRRLVATVLSAYERSISETKGSIVDGETNP